MTYTVAVSRQQAASQRLAGQLLLSFQGSQWESVPIDVSARDFAAALLRLQTGTMTPHFCVWVWFCLVTMARNAYSLGILLTTSTACAGRTGAAYEWNAVDASSTGRSHQKYL